MPLKVEAGTAGKTGARTGRAKGGGLHLSRPDSMSESERLLFTSELADLLEGGMTLGDALNALARRSGEADGPGQVVGKLRDAILEGTAFSDALAAFPKIFSPVYINMIRAGEASGALKDVLRRLIAHDERQRAMKSKISSAMVYPMIVLCMGIAVAIFAMTYILPKFQSIFDSIGPDSLPPLTKIMLGTNDWIKKWWLALVIGIGGALFGFKRWTATPRGRKAWDGFKLKAPLIKGIVASSVYANFASTLESLLRNGVPILRALDLTSQTVGNTVVGDELRNAKERVTDGTTISGPLSQSGVFPPMVIDMIAIGERTGDMPTALEHVSTRFERQLEKNILVFTTALEPIMICAVALIIGFIAVAIMQAVLSVTSGMDLRG